MGYDSLYSVFQEDYSPEASIYVDAAQAVPPTASSAQSPMTSSNLLDAAVVPAPPSPSVGGMPGISRALGWSTGLRNSRSFRQAFDGRTLVVSNMGPHPVSGPVGFSSRTDRLYYGTQALTSDNMPTNADVTKSFASPNAADIVAATAGNPAYVQ